MEGLHRVIGRTYKVHKTNPVDIDNINTHENAIETLLIVAQQRLEDETRQHRLTPSKESENNIAVLAHIIKLGYDYLDADGYTTDSKRGLHIKE